MSVKLKVCGLKREEDIDIVNKYDIDYGGFVFFKKSSRFVSKQKAKILSSLLNENITPVGVFVNEDIDYILDLYKEGIIAIAQLHGSESEDYIKNLKKKSKDEIANEIPIIKSIEINERIEDVDAELAKWRNSDADYFILDSGKGSGCTFDWDLVDKNDELLKKPFFLAGGLNEDNLDQAIYEFNPYAVDLSSSLETDGFKDEDKIKKVVEIVNKCKK